MFNLFSSPAAAGSADGDAGGATAAAGGPATADGDATADGGSTAVRLEKNIPFKNLYNHVPTGSPQRPYGAPQQYPPQRGGY